MVETETVYRPRVLEPYCYRSSERIRRAPALRLDQHVSATLELAKFSEVVLDQPTAFAALHARHAKPTRPRRSLLPDS